MRFLTVVREKSRALLAWVSPSLGVRLLILVAFVLAVLIGLALPTRHVSAQPAAPQPLSTVPQI